jgi:DNA-binding MarR family transcriptional regulator
MMRRMSDLPFIPEPSPTDGPPAAGATTMSRPLDARLAAWRAFLMAHSLVTRRLDDELRIEHGLSLAEYDALLQLAQAPDRRLRMNQLAERVILSRSGVTRLVDRLEADGLVTRRSCSSDARGAEAVLTDAGLERLRAASPTHLRGVERYFLDALTMDELHAVEHALDAVIERSARGTTFEGCSVHGIPDAGRPT